MAERAVLSVLLLLYRTITFTDPNTGNEMGRCEGDEVSKFGNYSYTTALVQRLFMFVLAMFSVGFRSNIEVKWFDWLMILIATAGVVLSQWAYATLGRFYTFQLGTRKDHYLVSDGPYQYLLHPGYFGQFMLNISSILFFRIGFFTTTFILIVAVQTLLWRIKNEEIMLERKFPDWNRHKSTRWHFIPFIW